MVTFRSCLLVLFFWALTQCCAQYSGTNDDTLRAIHEKQLKRYMDRLFEAMQEVFISHNKRIKQQNSVRIHCRFGSFSGAFELYHLDETLHKERVLLENAINPLLDRYAENFCEYLTVNIDVQGSIKDRIEREATWLSWVTTGKHPSQSESGTWLAEQFTGKVKSRLQKWGLKV
jgi:hypothetical protein